MVKRGNGEGSITRLSDGRFQARVTLPTGKRKAYYGRSRTEVAGKLTDALKSVRDSVPLPGERLKVGSFLESWLENSASQKVRPKTLRFYRDFVRLHIAPAIGSVALAKLTPQQVEKMLAVVAAKGTSPRTVNHCRAVLRNALGYAMKHSLVARNVASLADAPSVPEPETHVLSPRDASQILVAVRGDRLEALFAFALACGLRQSEALGLRWRDVDAENSTLSVQRTIQRVNKEYIVQEPKTKRSRRTISLPGPVSASLSAHKARQLEERLRAGPNWEGDTCSGLVFTDELGRPLSGFHVSRRFKKLMSLAGLPDMRYHDLRHGAASLMAVQGVPARVVMDILGHAQISTTMNIYAHVAPELQREAMSKVAASLWPGV